MTDAAETRNVLILYGFFFVMLSALLSASIQLMEAEVTIRLSVYFLSWFFALASALVGVGILRLFDKLPKPLIWGFFVLIALVPTAFLIVLGRLLLQDQSNIFNVFAVVFIAILFIVLITLYRDATRKIEQMPIRMY